MSIDQLMTDVWRQMLPGDRRALAVMGYCHTLDRKLAAGQLVAWADLESADRVALIRSMRHIGELAIDCAIVLAQARATVDADARG